MSIPFKKAFGPFLLTLGVLAITSLVVLGVGDSPLAVLKILFASAFGSSSNISYTIFYATPILLTACAVRLALSAGLFNIGAEGQMYIGAIAAVAYSTWFGGIGLPAPMHWIGALLFAMMAGALWSGAAAWLRTRYSVHEVISTILLNFIAYALVNWLILDVFKNHNTQNVETVWIPASLRLSPLWGQATKFAPLALAIAFGLHWILGRTWFGFRVRATGLNSKAASVAGIEPGRYRLGAMLGAGALAAIAGYTEVFGHSYRLIDGFSPGYGFMGLAVALIARENLSMLVGAALLFGALQKGALDLDLETEHVTRDLAAVIQAVVLLALAVQTRKKDSK